MDPPRPLAGLPAVDSRAIARAWLVRRIAAAPLEAAADLAGGAFAARGPGLCRLLTAAVADDAALTVLVGEGATLHALVDAGRSPPAAVAADLAAATEHLRRAALDVAIPGTDPALHPALHDRLAHACAQLLRSALAGSGAPAASAGPGTSAASAAFTLRDERARSDPRGHLTAEAERLVVARVPFALLALEVEDAGVVHADVLATAEAALRAALPPGALHAPDGPGSMLVLAREADGGPLARALTQAVAAAGSHRGAPLRAAAGVAEHPRDGDTPEGLLAHADRQLFAARAEGLPLA